MAQKSLLKYQTITSGNMASATVTSAVTNIQYLNDIAISFVFTGSPVGTFAVHGSIDYAQDQSGNVTNTGTWSALSLTPAPAATGSADNILINMNNLGFPWIRAVYTKTSGTGTLNAYISGKQK